MYDRRDYRIFGRLQQVVLHAALILGATADDQIFVHQLEFIRVRNLEHMACIRTQETATHHGKAPAANQTQGTGLVRTSLNSTQTRTGP